MVTIQRLVGVAALALPLACSPASVTVTSDDTGSAGSSSTTEPEPERLRFSRLALAGGRLCAIGATDGRIVCRDHDCDLGLDPNQWQLDDPACWRASELPDAAYAALVLDDGAVCGLRTDDGAVVCESGAVPLGDGHVDLASASIGRCATDGDVLRCSSGALGALTHGVTAVDGDLALVSGSVVDIPTALLGCVEPWCAVVAGDFIDVFGAGHQSGCGLRGDGTVDCTADLEPIVEERSVAGVAFAPDGARCIRFAEGDVDCSFGPAPPADDLVELAVSDSPVDHACGIRSDATMVCWGEEITWCGSEVCLAPRECFEGQCLDCREGCVACGDEVCVGEAEFCVEDTCRTCFDPPCTPCGATLCGAPRECHVNKCLDCSGGGCTPCGEDVCDGSEDCLGDQCLVCGELGCTPCGDTYCLEGRACSTAEICVPPCSDTADCGAGSACIDGGCESYALPDCVDPLELAENELTLPIDVRGTTRALPRGDRIDLLVAGQQGAWVVEGPDLTEVTQVVAHAGGLALRPAVGDFDGDGDMDVALADVEAATFTIYVDEGGWIATESSTLRDADAGELVAGDADGDGLADLFYAYEGGALNDGVSWHRNLGVGLGFERVVDDSSAVVGVAVDGRDLDGDGLVDFAYCDDHRAKFLTPATDLSPDTLEAHAFVPIEAFGRAVALGDFDGDGQAGLAFVQHTGVTFWIDVWGEPTAPADDTHGSSSVAGSLPTGPFAFAIDVDDDLADDLVIPIDQSLRVWRGGGSPGAPFQCTTDVAMPIAVETITAADFDGDGAIELVVGGSPLDPLYLLR